MGILSLFFSCFYTINLLKSIYYLGPTPRRSQGAGKAQGGGIVNSAADLV
jgi:hypothetical protein